MSLGDRHPPRPVATSPIGRGARAADDETGECGHHDEANESGLVLDDPLAAAPFGMKLPSFVQHLSVLERSRLVKARKRGRVRTYEIAPERFRVAEDRLTERRRSWESRFDRFDDYVKRLEDRESRS